MRPAGEVRQAVAASVLALCQRGRRATLREIAGHACVGLESARVTVQNMTRAGHLVKAGERRVSYRNRPVVEYAPALDVLPVERGSAVVDQVLRSWIV